jgi:hypothetical protein
MSNTKSDIVPFGSASVPDHIRARGQSDLTKSLMKGTTSKRISIKGKVFRLVVGGEELAKITTGSIDVVVVNIAPSIHRTYYAAAYDPKAADGQLPACWSADGKVPHESISEPMAPACNGCRMNISGSGQGSSRACRFKQVLAVALAGDLASGVYQLELPATSIFGTGDPAHMPWQQYFKYVSSQSYSIDRLVTRISFDTDAESPKLLFNAIGFPSEAMLAITEELGTSPEAVAATTVSYSSRKTEEPKVARSAPKRETPAAKPAMEDVLLKFAGKSAASDSDEEG